MSEAPELPSEQIPPNIDGEIIETEFSFTNATKLLGYVINSTPVRTKDLPEDLVDDVFVRLRNESRNWLITTSKDLNNSPEHERRKMLQTIGNCLGEYAYQVSSIRAEFSKIIRSKEFVLRNTNEEQ